MSSISRAFRVFRRQKGFSLRELSVLSDVTSKTIWLIESCGFKKSKKKLGEDVNVTLKTLLRLCDALDIELKLVPKESEESKAIMQANELAETIISQSKDNPEMAKSILGESIVQAALKTKETLNK